MGSNRAKDAHQRLLWARSSQESSARSERLRRTPSPCGSLPHPMVAGARGDACCEAGRLPDAASGCILSLAMEFALNRLRG